MTSKETLKLVAKGGTILLLALIIFAASAGCLNYAHAGHGFYYIPGIVNLVGWIIVGGKLYEHRKNK